MTALTQFLQNAAINYGPECVFSLLGAGVVWAYYKLCAYRNFRLRRTNKTITCSLNTVKWDTIDGTARPHLYFRTLLDQDSSLIINLSPATHDIFVRACAQTTIANPLPPLGKVILDDIMNDLSAMPSNQAGLLAADNHLPVRQIRYVFAATCERFDRTLPHFQEQWEKPRVIVIKESVLLETDFSDAAQWVVEQEHHRDRIRLLHAIQQDYANPYPQASGVMELYVRS